MHAALVRRMLAAEPSERITLNQVCAHPWVCGGAAEELAAAAGTQEGAASILAGCSAEEPGSLDIHPVCQSLDEPMVLGSLPLGGTLGTTMEDRFSENAMGVCMHDRASEGFATTVSAECCAPRVRSIYIYIWNLCVQD